MAFEDDEEFVEEPSSRLKVSNKNSSIKAPLKTSETFEKKVSENIKKSEEYKNKAKELTSAFVSIIKDTTLPDNKGPVSKEMEASVLENLIQLGIDMNNDQDEQEGMGSIGLINLLFKTLVYQRDKINGLEHKLHVLSKSIK